MSKALEGEDGEFTLVSDSPTAGRNNKRVYGFQHDGKFYLSKLPKSAPKRPAARFDTLADAERAAAARSLQIEWEA